MASDVQEIRILTVDDHALLRKGIGALISAEPDMTLVAEASNGLEAIAEFKKHRPDITLNGFANAGNERHRVIDFRNARGVRRASRADYNGRKYPLVSGARPDETGATGDA